MQSLYNIAGFLGAQSRSNPSDHGDSWTSHKAAKLQSPSQGDTNSFAFEIGDIVKLVSDKHLNEGWARDLTLGNTYRVVEVDHDSTNMPIMISDDIQDHIWVLAEDFILVSAEEPKLTPINPNTIKVGAIVRLIGNKTISSPSGRDLTIGNNYEVIAVDRQPDTQLAIMISDDVHDHIWAFHEDFQQVT